MSWQPVDPSENSYFGSQSVEKGLDETRRIIDHTIYLCLHQLQLNRSKKNGEKTRMDKLNKLTALEPEKL